MTHKEILATVDHTLLAQTATWEEIKVICDDGAKYHTASVCIPPCYVKQAKEYTGDNQDRLSSFKVAASLQGCTPQRALVGMMAKHIVSLYDMCYAKNAAFKKELWDEKITDSLNYLFLLAAIIKEEGTYEQN